MNVASIDLSGGRDRDGQDAAEDASVREAGRTFLLALSSALRSVAQASTRMRAVALLKRVVDEIIGRDGHLELKVVGDLVFVNGLKLEHDLDNYAAFGHVLGTLRRNGVGLIRCVDPPKESEWRVFLPLLLGTSVENTADSSIDDTRLASANRYVKRIMVAAPGEGDAALPDVEVMRKMARKTYAESIAVTRELFSGSRMGRTAKLKDVKHALQNIVDQVLNNQSSLAGLSTLKDYDDYSFRHAVNVCIFCVAVGKRLGLTKQRLYDLGMAALVHDMGMSRVPAGILDKQGRLSPTERSTMEAHTFLGAMSAFELRDHGGVPYRSMIAAYEHHMKLDLSGYPQSIRARAPSVFPRIIAVADAFDAATNTRPHVEAKPADEVLKQLWEDEALGFDPVIVKALINVLGVYPVGTLVILDTHELAIVSEANPDAAHIHRPLVRIICSVDGMWLDDPPLVDLAESLPEGPFRRSIIKVTNADRYGVRVSEYFA